MGQPELRDAPADNNPAGPSSSPIDATHFEYRTWTTQDGLPQNSVSAIVQTRDGYLWLGTFGGLARFDGMRFTLFDISNTKALTSNRILSLLEDRSGNLWIGTQGGGVVRLRGGVFTSYSGQENAPSGQVWSIVQDRDGVVWFGADHLVSYAGGRFELAGPDEWITPLKQVWSLLVDSEQSLWVATTGGLGRFRDGKWRVFGMADGLIRNDVRFMHEDSRGLLWVRTGGRLFHLDGDKFVESLVQGEQPGRIFAAALDGSGKYWVGSDRGLFHVRAVREDGDGSSDRTLFQRAIKRAAAGSVRALLKDREGNIWVGTDGDGLLRLRAALFESFKPPSGMIVSSNVESLAGDGGEGLWIACSPKDIGHFKDDEWWKLPADNDIRDIRAISSSSDGTLWIQHHGLTRLSKYRDRQFTHLEQEFDPIKGVLVDRQGTVWISSAGGLSSIRDGRIETITVADGLPSMGGGGVLSDSRDGTIWIGADGALTRYRNGEFNQYTSADGLPRGRVRSIHEGSDGNLWITTYGGGMARLRDGKFTRYTTLEGLPDNSLGKILEDDAGNLWINSNRGVFRVSLNELNAFAAGRRSKINCRTFRTGEAGGQSGVRTPDGRLWFPTIEGLITIDPGMVAVNDGPPPIIVEWVRVFGKSFDRSDRIRLPIDRSDRIELPLDRRDVVIKYTGLSFVDPDNVIFRYRLIGYDEDWVDAGTRRRAAYQHIPPGTYEFQVQARNNDRAWSEHAATLGITVPAHFYETAWFLVLCGFAVTATFFVGHRIRTRNIERRNAELGAEITERRRAVIRARQRNEEIELVFQALPDLYFRMDAQGTILDYRANRRSDLYLPPEEFLGRRMQDVIPPMIGRLFEKGITEVLTHGGTTTFEYPLAKNERQGYYEGRLVRLGDDQVIAVVRDVTQRRRAEEELRLRQFAIDHGSDPIYWVKADGGIAYANQAACRSLGYGGEEFLSMSVSDFDPDFPREAWSVHWAKMRDACPITFESRHRTKQGRVFPVEISANFLEHEGQEYMWAYARDITERKQAEEALQESEERYRSLLNDALDSTKVGLFILDAKFQIVWLNQAIERFFSLRREDVIGKDKRQLIGERIRGIFEDPETFSDKVLATYDNNTYVENFECHVLPDGEREDRWLEHWSHPIRSGLYAGGRIELYYDITERRRAEEAKEHLAEQLHQSQKMEALGQLAAGVAHDFNNLLMVMLGRCEQARGMLPVECDAREALRDTEQAALKARELTNSLLTFSRRGPSKREPVDLCSVVNQAATLIRSTLPSNVELAIDACSPPVWVIADSNLLQQLLLNLAINARDAMPDGGSLRISIDRAPAEQIARLVGEPVEGSPFALIEVTDTGTGMTSEVRSHALEPFYTTKPRGQGTGLGLAIVLGIVQDHNGLLEIETEKDKGCKIKIILPGIDADSVVHSHDPIPAQASGQGEVILFLSDQAAERALISAMLQSGGYEVVQAATEESFRDRFESHRGRIRLLLIDLHQSEDGGLACLRRLRDDEAATAAIVVTGDGGLQLEAPLKFNTTLLHKPFQMADLERLVAACVQESCPPEEAR